MKPERWKQVDELLEAALDCPATERASFLDGCSGDENCDGGPLLMYDGRAKLSLSRLGKVGPVVHRQPSAGKDGLAHYEIIAPIRAGVGEVYLAQDTGLGREWPQVLPPCLQSTPTAGALSGGSARVRPRHRTSAPSTG
jgi:hypothetical protein